ncbi:hypothetical protein P378_01785 [Desulforamulus profundi]|uniref:Uncharacterized protein n=1 Tax=Desulforamulus profundi TaxID=1383067 RepID=A0A2C6MIR2_9FIRM|nr:hypothetical protein P378_01785 [Desulforamulus profundi]
MWFRVFGNIKRDLLPSPIFGAMPQMDVTFFQPVGEAGLMNILKGVMI